MLEFKNAKQMKASEFLSPIRSCLARGGWIFSRNLTVVLFNTELMTQCAKQELNSRSINLLLSPNSKKEAVSSPTFWFFHDLWPRVRAEVCFFVPRIEWRVKITPFPLATEKKDEASLTHTRWWVSVLAETQTKQHRRLMMRMKNHFNILLQ